MRRVCLILAVLALTSTSVAHARDGEPYFRSGSDGAPTNTLQGEWTPLDERSVRLDLEGGHAIGDRTWFEAGWVTPWVTGTHGQMASFDMTYDFMAVNVGRKIALSFKFRYQEPGGRWSTWFRHPKFDYEEPITFWGGGSMFGTTRERIRFDWRSKGVIEDPELVTGSITVSVS